MYGNAERRLYGGNQPDRITGADGDDVLDGGLGIDELDGMDGMDACLGGEHDENCESGLEIPTQPGHHEFLPPGSVYTEDGTIIRYAPAPTPSATPTG